MSRLRHHAGPTFEGGARLRVLAVPRKHALCVACVIASVHVLVRLVRERREVAKDADAQVLELRLDVRADVRVGRRVRPRHLVRAPREERLRVSKLDKLTELSQKFKNV